MRPGMRAPKFAVERVISGSQKLISGAPFDGGADSPLWADAKAKVGQAAGRRQGQCCADADACSPRRGRRSWRSEAGL